MTAITKRIDAGILPLPFPETRRDLWYWLADRRLNAVLRRAQEIPFDDDTRMVFFADSHRGDKSRVDAFAPNEPLFLNVLSYYFKEGFNYFEVGDGDELWKHRRFQDVRRAYSRVYNFLHRFHRQERLHLLLGNHDIQGLQRHRVIKDGLIAEEGFVLKHRQTGQRILVVHGHQADFKSDALHLLSRPAIRHVWKRIQQLGLGLNERHKHEDIEERLMTWAHTRRQFIICGHTHREKDARYGESPYFNTGSCLTPGLLTGLEIQQGEILPIRWTLQNGPDGERSIRRELTGPARRLRLFR